jgi:DNA-binding MarR family transcriptional regulator/uncharacterized C2H2 Zn-finger protein
MAANSRVQLIQDVLGRAHIFASAVNDLMEERLKAVSGEQLSFSQIKLLKLVARTESYKVGEVAAFLRVSNAAASKAVDRLVRRGLLLRNESEEDRRSVELALTPTGCRLLEQYEEVTRQTLAEIFAEVSEDGLRQTADLLDELSVSLVEREGEDYGECFRCSIYFRDKCLLRSKTQRTCHLHLHKRKNDKPTADGRPVDRSVDAARTLRNER